MKNTHQLYVKVILIDFVRNALGFDELVEDYEDEEETVTVDDDSRA